jgi:branched-chain amino acid transport system substrate-binding protein
MGARHGNISGSKKSASETVDKHGISRRGFIKTAAVTGAGLLAASCGKISSRSKEKIVVGMARPLTGPLAMIGDSAFKPVYETFIEEVNGEGGVYVKELDKRLPIEPLIYDDESDVAKMGMLTEKLIVEDEVDFLWPACSTSFIFAQAPIANKHGYLLITAEGGATSVKEMLPSLPYVFVTLSFSDWYQIPVLADLLQDKGATSAYIAYIADLHGIEYSGVAGIEFPKKGIEIIGVKSIPADMADLSPVIEDAGASGADVFCCFAYPDQIMPAMGASIELGFNPKAWIGGPGVNFGFFHTSFGPMAEGVLGFTSFSPKQSDAAQALADKLYTDQPEDIQDPWGHPLYWAGLEVWKQAIEKAGTLDQAAIRNVVASETFETVLGPTWFENGLLSKDCHTGEIGQWQNGLYEVVGPKDMATAEMVYPKPEFPT